MLVLALRNDETIKMDESVVKSKAFTLPRYLIHLTEHVTVSQKYYTAWRILSMSRIHGDIVETMKTQ